MRHVEAEKNLERAGVDRRETARPYPIQYQNNTKHRPKGDYTTASRGGATPHQTEALVSWKRGFGALMVFPFDSICIISK